MNDAATVASIALIVTAWAVWMRRLTWANRWEASTTLSISLLGIGILFTSPIADATVGKALHAAAGRYNLENWLGHVCIIASAAAILYSALCRLYDDEALNIIFRRWVERPIVLSITLLLAMFVFGGLGATPLPMARQPPWGWASTYYALMCATVIYLLAYATRALVIIRRDSPTRRVANLYLIACVSGISVCATRAVTALITPLQDDGFMVGIFGCLWLGIFAVAAAYSWRLKRRLLRSFKQAVR
jgi:hypothetical protein